MEDMELRFIGKGHDPHEYEGLVFNMPKERIPIRLARELDRVGSIELWQYQAFVHHEHPALGNRDPLVVEPRLVEKWKELLSTRFPTYRFVIMVSPRDRMTWYQPTESAPFEDDLEFEDYSPPVSVSASGIKALLESLGGDKEASCAAYREQFRQMTRRTGSVGTCEVCGEERGFGEPAVAPNHRGIRLVDCLACGAELIHSTKTIRFVVGPEPSTLDE